MVPPSTSPNTQDDSAGKMGALTYVPLALWLVLSNILAFLMLMVVAPKAEDFVEQSLQQKRLEHESNAPVVEAANRSSSVL